VAGRRDAEPWAINTLSLEPRDLATLMVGYARLKGVWPEGWLGEEWAFWRGVWEFAGSVVVRQQYLPAVIEAVIETWEDPSRWLPFWQPVYEAEDLRHHEQLAASMPVVARAVRWEPEPMPPDQPRLLIRDMVARLVDCLMWMAQLTSEVSRHHAPGRRRWTWRSASLHERWVETLLSPDLELKGKDAEVIALQEQTEAWGNAVFTRPSIEEVQRKRQSNAIFPVGTRV